MSSEFWYGVLLTSVLFVLSTLLSIFAEDIRRNLKTRWHNRKLHGAALRIKRLRDELAEIEYYSVNPAALAAMFWSGFYIFLSVTIILVPIPLVLFQLPEKWAHVVAAIYLLVIWALVYAFCTAAQRKAERLSRPEVHMARLREHIAAAESATSSARA